MTEALLQDIRYTWRLLRRAPAFTAVAVLTLALGIGANTAIFSIVNGVILRPLKYPAAGRLMYLTTRFGVPGPKAREFWISPPEYMEFREINRSFSEVGAYTTGEVNLTAGDRPIRARSALVDEHLLEALGVRPAQRLLFARGETDVTGPPQLPGQPPPLPPSVAILSYELWQSAFGGRPLVGRTVEVDGRAREVVGIMPPATDLTIAAVVGTMTLIACAACWTPAWRASRTLTCPPEPWRRWKRARYFFSLSSCWRSFSSSSSSLLFVQ